VLLVCTHWESPSVWEEQATLENQQRVREVLKKVLGLGLDCVEKLNSATKKETTKVRKKLSNLVRELEGVKEALKNITLARLQ